MKILALDLSTHSSGYAIGDDTNVKLENYGCITQSSKDVVKRIIGMRNQIQNLIKENNIQKIIMEQVRPEVNSHTNKVLMWLQAAIVIAAYQINPKIQHDFIGASSWRSKLSMKQGKGVKRQYLKNQDIEYVKQHYGITVNDDIADAICILEVSFQEDQMIIW